MSMIISLKYMLPVILIPIPSWSSSDSSTKLAAIRSPQYIRLKNKEAKHLLIGKVKYVKKRVKADFWVGLWKLVDLVKEDATLVSTDLP